MQLGTSVGSVTTLLRVLTDPRWSSLRVSFFFLFEMECSSLQIVLSVLSIHEAR